MLKSRAGKTVHENNNVGEFIVTFLICLFALAAAMLAVLLTDPAAVPPIFTGVFMDKMVGFVKNYFPVFLLGAVFGKVIELSGFSKSITAAVIRLLRPERAA